MELLPPPATSKAPATRFTGDVWVDTIPHGNPPSRLRAALVRFAPGAHTAWHRHLNGQTLHILDGRGLVQARGGQVIEVGPGDTIETPPGEWHWHGAAPDHFMTHLALSLDLADGQPGPVTEWGNHLTADEYPGQ
jgi:quercetin dioxygenase-like cupin family protein